MSTKVKKKWPGWFVKPFPVAACFNKVRKNLQYHKNTDSVSYIFFS